MFYWYGSRLSIEEARRVAPHNNATSLQVTAAVLAGIIWAIENPRRGIVEPDEMDYDRILEIAGPYLGEMVEGRGATGRRSRTASASSPKTSTATTPGSSRTSGSFEIGVT